MTAYAVEKERQAAEERPFAVHGIEAFRLGPGHVDHLHGRNFELVGFQSFDHLADETAADAVRFDDRQSSFHGVNPFDT